MLRIELPISIVILIFCFIDVTSSFFNITSRINAIGLKSSDDSASYYYGSSSSSSETKIQDYIGDSTAKCIIHRTADELARFLTTFAETLAEATIIKLDRMEDKLASFESAEKNNTSSQVMGLKEKVTETANKAHCPAPDDPSLMGEFDSIIELVYEMCYSNYVEKAEKMRWEALFRVNLLVRGILSSVKSIREVADEATRVCLEIVEESKNVLQYVEQLIEGQYKSELKSVYSSCFNIAYKHAENFMPSVIERATSCRASNWQRTNHVIKYNDYSTTNKTFV